MLSSQRKFFGTDGVRGMANLSPMDSETALAIGRAMAHVFKSGKHRHKFVIGKDTRLSGYMIETALASGICSMGADVMLVGPLPTPGIAFIAKSMGADAGVVISASHNPYHDNGIKIFDRSGFKLPDEVELRIEKLVQSNLAGIERPTGNEIGKALRLEDADGRYVQFLKDSFPSKLTLEGLRIVVDCAHGAGYKVAPAVFEELGAEVIELGVHPDGVNINDGLGALHPARMCELVEKVRANAGIALDGDADRIIMCDEKGKIVDGDVIMALSAIDLMQQGKLAKNTLVATIMSNLAMDDVLKNHGINVVRTKVGDRYVISAMRECGYNFGGEQSGHMIFLDHNTTGDGILGGLKVLATMQSKQKLLSELAQIFEPYPQVKMDVSVQQKRDFQSIPEIRATLEKFTSELGKSGRLMVRYSGTENIARVLVEGPRHERIKLMAQELVGLINTHLA